MRKSETVLCGVDREKLTKDLLKVVSARFPKSEINIRQCSEKSGTMTIFFEVNGENMAEISFG
ncbi:hypothetical protein L4D09_18860 [Photobacterium makurazakiensis]|uniref:hypothetical protein n=1 Tax=Photobacterium makurazakiensis TaxID=2910234 RepID=UPI003D0D3339